MTLSCPTTLANDDDDDDRARRVPLLSEREKEVLVAYVTLPTTRDVARTLHVEPCTVSTHLARIRGKYARVGRPVSSKTWTVIRALQDGFVTLDELRDCPEGPGDSPE